MCSINVHKTYTDQVLVKKYIYRNVQSCALTYKTFIKQLKVICNEKFQNLKTSKKWR